MSIIVKSGATSDVLTVDPTSKAARVTVYDPSGNALTSVNRAAVAETAGGTMLAAKDYKLARTLRATSDGSLAVADDQMLLYDSYEGATKNQNIWVETVAGAMAAAQTVASGLTLNSGSITTITTGVMEFSHRGFPAIMRSPLIFRTRLRCVSFNASVAEWGFGVTPAAATTAIINDGAFFRKDASGSLQGVISQNGVEVQTATMTLPANTDYATYSVMYEPGVGRALFQIMDDKGVLVGSVYSEPTILTTPRSPSVTHLNAFHRLYNSGTPGTAPQVLIDKTSVYLADQTVGKPWRETLAGLGYNSATSPTTYAQAANYANNTAPTARTLSNTAAAETTLGGWVRANSIAGAATDLILFGFTVPAPYTFYFTGIRIPAPLNEVVAVATTDTMFTYGLAFNSSAVSLATGAPYSPMRMALGGVHRGAVGLAANAQFSGNDVIYNPATPIAIQPGRFFHVICRELVGTATGTETYQWGVAVDGWFE